MSYPKLLPTLCAAFLLAAPAAVPASPSPVRLSSSNFQERYLETVPVSGAILVGIQYLDKQDIEHQVIWAQLPATHPPELCIAVVTDDGRYSATESFHLTDGAQGLVALDFPTRRLGDLGRYGSQRIAMLAVLKRSCDDATSVPDDIYVPLSWVSNVGSSRLLALINSGGSDVQVFSSPDGPLTDCDSLGIHAAKIAFDTQCTLSVPKIGNLWNGYLTLGRFGEAPRQFHVQIWTRR